MSSIGLHPIYSDVVRSRMKGRGTIRISSLGNDFCILGHFCREQNLEKIQEGGSSTLYRQHGDKHPRASAWGFVGCLLDLPRFVAKVIAACRYEGQASSLPLRGAS